MSTVAIVRHELIKNKRSRHKPRVFRTPVVSAFELNDDYFKTVYRVTKKTAERVLEILRPELDPKSGIKTAVSAESKVLCALRYFASGSLQRQIGQELLVHLSQAAVSRAIVGVCDGICKHFNNLVSFPEPSEYADTVNGFSEAGGFPGVIGATGCMHIGISTPPDIDLARPKHGFLNPRGHYSLNVLFVCDADMKITYVNAQYPGASMDWFVWKYSNLRSILEERHSNDGCDSWLLGGSSFQPEPWLLTPINEPVSEAEETYNLYHERTRTAIVECTQLLKQRFGCLRHGIRHSANVAERIVKACAILHNMSLDDSDDEDIFQNEVVDSDYDRENYSTVNDIVDGKNIYVPKDESMHETALLQRYAVVDSYFS